MITNFGIGINEKIKKKRLQFFLMQKIEFIQIVLMIFTDVFAGITSYSAIVQFYVFLFCISATWNSSNWTRTCQRHHSKLFCGIYIYNFFNSEISLVINRRNKKLLVVYVIFRSLWNWAVWRISNKSTKNVIWVGVAVILEGSHPQGISF